MSIPPACARTPRSGPSPSAGSHASDATAGSRIRRMNPIPHLPHCAQASRPRSAVLHREAPRPAPERSGSGHGHSKRTPPLPVAGTLVPFSDTTVGPARGCGRPPLPVAGALVPFSDTIVRTGARARRPPLGQGGRALGQGGRALGQGRSALGQGRSRWGRAAGAGAGRPAPGQGGRRKNCSMLPMGTRRNGAPRSEAERILQGNAHTAGPPAFPFVHRHPPVQLCAPGRKWQETNRWGNVLAPIPCFA